MMEGVLSCPMCRDSRSDFAANHDMITYMEQNGIRPGRSDREMGEIKLQILFLRLTVGGSFMALDLDNIWNQIVIDPCLSPPPAHEPGLPDSLVQELESFPLLAEDLEGELPLRIGGSNLEGRI